MNCRELQERMYEVAFGEAERDSAFNQHLENCVGCKKEFAAIGFAASGIQQAAAPPAPSLSNERLRTAILSHNLKSRPSLWPRLSFAGAAAALAFAAWFGFSQNTEDYQQPVVAVNGPAIDVQPSGPIVIPEPEPAIEQATEPVNEAAEASTPPVRRSKVRTSQPRETVVPSEEIPDDLLAVVVGGAEGALDGDFSAAADARMGSAMMEPAPAAISGGAMERSEGEKPIVVIQPKGKATERSSDDVPIGG
jgi:hypothetical protein